MICPRCGKDVDGVHTCAPRKTDRFIIGKYLLNRTPDGSLWIEIQGDGEGGVFNEADLYAVLDKFYKENF